VLEAELEREGNVLVRASAKFISRELAEYSRKVVES
jgi:hypothetical protein